MPSVAGEQYFRTTNTSNRGAICFNNAMNEHTQKLSDGKFYLNINEGVIQAATRSTTNESPDSFENYKFQYPQRIIFSLNLFVQLTGALDLYDGQSENGAIPIVNNTSSVKLIDLETWYYKTYYDNQSQECDTPVLCTFVGNFQQYPQMLIIVVSNQLYGITLQGIDGQGFSNVYYKQNLIGVPILWKNADPVL
ncbi:MAG: hypothetical protein EZS28_025500 [Streblomastix strix]|uniref:Uncharacterized protein n=1 Tax=Streblomastix strix TaxID=222440 RepID=A0A5J4V965_9EUKA|nr:MAG: hypothetical protein EZS28_025500 [Streblomastix strix]